LCLVFDLIVLDSGLPSSGRRFAVSLLHVPPTHPTENLHVNPHRKPRVNPHDNLKRRGEGRDLRHEDRPGGWERRGSGANAPDAGFAKEVCGVPGSWQNWKLKGIERHRCGDALGLEDLGIVSPKLRKSGNFFFVLID
jgi:hypothetical protein